MSIETLIYPSDLLSGGTNDQMVAKQAQTVYFMPIETIERSNVFSSNTSQTSEAKCLICLPMPQNLSDATSHNWSEATAFDALDSVASLASNVGGGVGEAVGGLLNGGVAIMKGTVENSGYAELALAMGMRKKMFNPGYFQNYTGTSLRSFDLTYTFQPRSRTEAETTVKIIQTFKKYSSPSTDVEGNVFTDLSNSIDSSSNSIISSVSSVSGTIGSMTEQTGLGDAINQFSMVQPCYWKITFGNKYLNNLIKMGHVVISQISVTYGDNVETFKDGMPKTFTLTMSFKEINMVTQESYDTDNGDSLTSEDSGVTNDIDTLEEGEDSTYNDPGDLEISSVDGEASSSSDQADVKKETVSSEKDNSGNPSSGKNTNSTSENAETKASTMPSYVQNTIGQSDKEAEQTARLESVQKALDMNKVDAAADPSTVVTNIMNLNNPNGTQTGETQTYKPGIGVLSLDALKAL